MALLLLSAVTAAWMSGTALGGSHLGARASPARALRVAMQSSSDSGGAAIVLRGVDVWAGNNPVMNPGNPTWNTSKFVTAMLKGRSRHFALKVGDAQSGQLRTVYDGPRPLATR